MKKIYFDAIRSGRKTTTLRYWKHRRVRPGSVHSVPGLGKVRIDAVRQVDLHELTDADARSDGLAGLAELRRALADCYDDAQRSERSLYLVTFTYPVGHGKGSNPSQGRAFREKDPADGR